MAVTTEYSDVATAQRSPSLTVEADQYSGRVVPVTFKFTQGAAAGDANSVAVLFQSPAQARLLTMQSMYSHSAFGAARLLSLGWLAYTDENGDTQAANLTALASGVDVALAGVQHLSTAHVATLPYLFATPRWIAAQVTGATIPIGATISGTFLFALG